MTIERRGVGKRLSEMVVFQPAVSERLVFLAGQVADDPKADITGQAQQVLAQIDELLFEVRSDKTRLLTVTIYLPDMKNFAAMNAVWEAWVAPGHPPARATVQASLAAPEYLIEIQVVATAPAVGA